MEEQIPDHLLASIPDHDARPAAAETPADDAPAETIILAPAAPDGASALAVAQRLRYDMGEIFARELDRAEQIIATALADRDAQIARLMEQMSAIQAENEELRRARERAERKLRAFQELARDDA